jgi:hypothetical protein
MRLEAPRTGCGRPKGGARALYPSFWGSCARAVEWSKRAIKGSIDYLHLCSHDTAQFTVGRDRRMQNSRRPDTTRDWHRPRAPRVRAMHRRVRGNSGRPRADRTCCWPRREVRRAASYARPSLPFFKYAHYVCDFPQSIRDARRQCWRQPMRFMQLTEVIVDHEERDRVGVVLQLF